MNRCNVPFNVRLNDPFPIATLRRSLALAGLLLCASSASAQTLAAPQQIIDAQGRVLSVRTFPPLAVRGTLQVVSPPDVLLNGKAERLSPGARIRGGNGILVMSATLIGQTLPVMTQREIHGLLHEVWLLTETEAQRYPMPQPYSATGAPAPGQR